MKRALVVDDNDAVRELLVGFVRHSQPDAQVDDVASGEEALTIFEASKYNFVILDIALVGMSGVDVGFKMREMDEHVIIIGITGYAELVEECDFTAAGFDVCFAKPLSFKEFFDYVRSL